MKWIFCLALVSCGFGLDDGSGKPKPATDYWGWQCADGTAPDPQSGCLPPTCDDNSTPAASSDGTTCVCKDGSQVLLSVCASSR